MKKLLYISILLLVCNGSGYFFYYFLAVAEARSHAATLIYRGDESNNYLRVSASSVKDQDADELWYEGKLYDVAKRAVIRDTLYLYLYRDREEEDLDNACSDYFQNRAGSLEVKHKTGPLNMPDGKYLIPDGPRLTVVASIQGKEFAEPSFLLPSITTRVLIPPPRPVS